MKEKHWEASEEMSVSLYSRSRRCFCLSSSFFFFSCHFWLLIFIRLVILDLTPWYPWYPWCLHYYDLQGRKLSSRLILFSFSLEISFFLSTFSFSLWISNRIEAWIHPLFIPFTASIVFPLFFFVCFRKVEDSLKKCRTEWLESGEQD